MSTLNVANVTDGTTSVPTGYVVNGSAKAWLNSTQVGTQSVRDSLNISSLTDLGVGQTKADFTSNMNNDDFAGSFYTISNAGENYTNFDNHFAGGFGNKLASSFQTYSYTATGAVDSGIHDVIIMGELA